MYQSGYGLSRILSLKGINQKHREKQLVSINLIAIKVKTYIRVIRQNLFKGNAIQLTVAPLKGTVLYANVSILL